jgi:hypothetical protein
METKEFSLDIVLTLLTSKSFGGDFGDIHEAIEFVIGHPVWTHEMADKLLWEQLRENILEQHPDLETVDGHLINTNNVHENKQRYIEQFGNTRVLTKGTEVRHKHPLETAKELFPDKINQILTINMDKRDE